MIDDICRIKDRSELKTYLVEQTQILLHEFFEKGRADGTTFDELYYTLRKARGDRGLSNSEAALTAGLWGARQHGVELDFCGLSNHFPPNGRTRNIEDLRARVLSSDAILLSGPVYFGDRGSLAQRFLTFISRDKDCRAHIKGKLFAGLAVGAKRNGGQETSLIYQIIDACNMGMLAVGNDHETTAQYGGTGVAGDVGAFASDDYGLKTAVSTGARIGRWSRMGAIASASRLTDVMKVGVWLIQDQRDGHGRRLIEGYLDRLGTRFDNVEFELLDLTGEKIYPCIACDVCPTRVSSSVQDYRCIVTQRDDAFVKYHEKLIDMDAFLLAAYSPREWERTLSVYQTFMERTRYLRRDDYAIGDRVSAPFVISEVGANQNLHLRMLTSAIRHHSVIHHPLIAFEHNGKILNDADVIENGQSFIEAAKHQTIARLAEAQPESRRYNPVGYIVSARKSEADIRDGLVSASEDARAEVHRNERAVRLG